MFYIGFVLFCTLYLLIINKYLKNSKTYFCYFFLNIPIIIAWTIFFGSQYNVGADYFEYKKMFEGYFTANRMILQGEYFFWLLTQISCYIGNILCIDGQMGFYFVTLSNAIVFNYITYSCQKRASYLLFFVLVTCTTALHSQMNILRQSMASFIACAGIAEFIKKKYVNCFCFFIIAIFTHFSFIYIIPIIFIIIWLGKIKNKKVLFLALLMGFVFANLNTEPILKVCGFILPQLAYRFEEGSFFANSLSFVNKVSRFCIIPLILLSFSISKSFWEKNNSRFFQLGVIMFAFQLSCLNVALLNRVGRMLEILAILPISYWLHSNINKSNHLMVFGIMGLMLFYYSIKVVFLPSGEFCYESFLSTII